MSSDGSCVWIHTSLLTKALGQETSGSTRDSMKKIKTLDREGEFLWTRCCVLSGDISAAGLSGTLKLQIKDETFEGNNEAIVEVSGLKSGEVVMANESAAAEAAGDKSPPQPPDDLITLTHLHEPSVVFSLKRRYENDMIYTNTGPILIALNPFKALPGLYDDDKMTQYWRVGEGVDDNITLPPHVYANADAAFRQMIRGLELRLSNPLEGMAGPSCDQSMLVSGESGAGKTVTTKHIMKYLASLSQRKADHAKRRRAPSPGRREEAPRRNVSTRRISRAASWKAGAQIEEQILESNPILESFGNARTIRNDNSSRFGKFIELQFKQTGTLTGAAIDTYLLEKVRLVHQSPGERNFHIFYEMLAAVTEDEREDYFLENYTAQDFKMLNMSGTYGRRDGANDADIYDKLVTSMSTMGFDPKTQEDIFKVTMSFLHALNCTFEAITDDSSKVDDSNPHLAATLKLLGLEKDDFQDALCQFEIEAGNTSYTRQVNKENAEKGLEALVKATYGSMFNFIVQSINKKIDYKPRRGEHKAAGKAAYIGVLDIFGFESFKTNSFEQLCINYCNEALQQQFNLYIFKSEQEEYKREGIEWDFVEFPDNADVIQLIDKKNVGIISILTDQCRGPRGTDKTFMDAMYKTCGPHSRFEATPLQQGKGQFVVHHFAGPVMYLVEGFVEKNKDEIPRGAATLLENSTNEFVQLLGKISAEKAVPSGGRGKKRPTAGGQFASQLNELRKRIDLTSPHYIRCIKPNQTLSPNEFNDAMIADQLKYAGVLEAIRVSRVGYSQRYTHSTFVNRYRFIALAAVNEAADKTGVLVIAAAKKVFEMENPNAAPPADILVAVGIQKGETKIFLRQPAFEALERLRSNELNNAAVKIQALARRFIARCRFFRLRTRIINTQASARRFLARKYTRILRSKRASTKLQTQYRLYRARQAFLQKKWVALWFQKMARAKAGRKRFTELYNQRQLEIERSNRNYQAALTLQCMFRQKKAISTVEGIKKSKIKQDSFYGEHSEAVKILKAEKEKAAIQADKAAAVAKQTEKERMKEVDALKRELQDANAAAGTAKTSQATLAMVTAEMDALRMELAAAKQEAQEARAKLAVVEAENKELRESMGTGAFFAGGKVQSTQYDDHPDLKQLDMRIQTMGLRAKQGKSELAALVQSLAILR